MATGDVTMVDLAKEDVRYVERELTDTCCGKKSETFYCGCCVFVVVFLIVITVPFMIVTVEDTERAVAYDKIWATFADNILESGGVRQKPWAADIIRWKRVEETIEFRGSSQISCNSADGLQISLFVSFQYMPDPAKLQLLTMLYLDYETWVKYIRRQALSTIKNVCGDFTADDFQVDRGAVAKAMENQVRDTVDVRYNGVITKLQLRNVDRPTSYENAVKDKENARSEIQLARNEEKQAETRALTKIDIAKEERVRLLDTAETAATVTVAQATNRALAKIERAQNLATVYGRVKRLNSLTVSGVLTYISNEIFSSDVTLSVESPSELSFSEQL